MSEHETDFDKLPPTIVAGQMEMDDIWIEQVPESFGNYNRVAELGKGGFGIVYHVRHRSLGFDRALKVLDPRIAAEVGEKQRFLREARVLAGLHNVRQVVHIYEVSTEDDPWNWLLMELIPGFPLGENYRAVTAAHCLQWFRQTSATGEGRLPEDMVLQIFRDVLAALQAAHEKGIIHRDLKPGNILLMPDGGAKLADFGLVKLIDGNADAEEKGHVSTKNLPNSNRYMGTTAYMSPEQQDGEPLDARSDIYTLGLVIYELLVGHRPSLRMKLPHQMGLPVAEWWDDIIDQMLEVRPADRPASAAELALSLFAAVDRELSPSPKPPNPPTLSHQVIPSVIERPLAYTLSIQDIQNYSFLKGTAYIHPNIPKWILNNSIKVYGGDLDGVVLLLHSADSAWNVYQSGSCGFLLTPFSIYWKNKDGTPLKCRYDQIETIAWSEDKSIFSKAQVYVNGNAIDISLGLAQRNNDFAQRIASLLVQFVPSSP